MFQCSLLLWRKKVEMLGEMKIHSEKKNVNVSVDLY